MATQTEIQQLIQGLAPSGNNGNPNTAWNNTIPDAATMDALVRPGITANVASTGAWTPPAGSGQPAIGANPLANLPPLQDNGWSAAKPPAQNVTGGGTGPQGQGANKGPVTTDRVANPGKGGGAGWGTNPQGGRTLHGVDVSTWANSFRNQGLPVTSTGQINTAKMTDSNWSNFFESDAMKTAVNVLGNILDQRVPGNAWLQHQGKVDVSNIVTGLIDSALPFFNMIPGDQIGWLTDKIGKWLTKKGDTWLPDFIEDAIKDHYQDNQDERNAANAKRKGGGGGQAGNPFAYTGKTTDGLGLGSSNFGNSWSGTITVGNTPFQVGGSTGGGSYGGGGGSSGGSGGGGSSGGGGGSFGGSSGGGSQSHKGAKQAFLDMSQA